MPKERIAPVVAKNGQHNYLYPDGYRHTNLMSEYFGVMNKYIRFGLTSVLLLVVGFSVFKISAFYLTVHKANTIKNDLNNTVLVHTTEKEERAFTKESWNALKNCNDDFVGYISFEDGYLEEPIVQGMNNDFYLNHDVNGSFSEFGTVFMDAENTMADQNITLYGHNVFMGGNLMFTPLSRLIDQHEYDTHHRFRIYWENQYSEYEITHVYYWDEIYDKDFDYKQNQFYTDDEFSEYLGWINQHNEITSEESLEKGSSFVSLQTCKDLSSSVRIVITAKEISKETY